MLTREQGFTQLEEIEAYDIVVIGGGATGLGTALDAVSRGLKVLVLEKYDFGKGTSSKSTKLLHGGVRYLQQGDVFLVMEALGEREFTINNASHLSDKQEFIIPIYSYFDALLYGVGLKVYDLLSGSKSLGKSRVISKKSTVQRLPNIKQEGLICGVSYYDGQFDDTRLCIDLVRTIEKHGGLCLNYSGAFDFVKKDGRVSGIRFRDELTNEEYEVRSKVVVNAAGVFADKIMELGNDESDIKIVPSRGSHLVLDRSFLQSDSAIMIPKTTDGRVLFIIPWKNVVIVGTTDMVTEDLTQDPQVTEEEIGFILTNAQNYLTKKPERKDILSTYAGLRPLAAPKEGSMKTKEISRSHKIVKSSNGLYSVLGGKWTTFRRMGQDAIDKMIKNKDLAAPKSTSIKQKIYNGLEEFIPKDRIHEDLPYSWNQINSAMDEKVLTLEDLLVRRTRCIFINTEATRAVFPKCLELLRQKLGRDEDWLQKEKANFENIMSKYALGNNIGVE